MKTGQALLPFILAALLGAGTAVPAADGEKPVYYVCSCGERCACGTIAAKPGACACGAELAAMRLLTVERDTALFCSCSGVCGCGVGTDDAGRCTCGRPLKRMNVKGRYKSGGCLCGGLEYTLVLDGDT